MGCCWPDGVLARLFCFTFLLAVLPLVLVGLTFLLPMILGGTFIEPMVHSAVLGAAQTVASFETCDFKNVTEWAGKGPNRAGPAIGQTVLWMDGNPMPDELGDFTYGTYDAATHTTSVLVPGVRSWSWHDNFSGMRIFLMTFTVDLTYRFEWSADNTSAHVRVCVAGGLLCLPDGNSLINFTMYQDPADPYTWVRKSKIIVPMNDYYARVLIDAEGNLVQKNYDLLMDPVRTCASMGSKPDQPCGVNPQAVRIA